MGHPECLSGKTFVITGSLETLTRTEAKDLIQRHSGRVTGSVSGKTTFLLAGRESGSRKVKTVGALLLIVSGETSHVHAGRKGARNIPLSI